MKLGTELVVRCDCSAVMKRKSDTTWSCPKCFSITFIPVPNRYGTFGNKATTTVRKGT